MEPTRMHLWTDGRHADRYIKVIKFASEQSQTRFPIYQCTYLVWWKSTESYSSYCPETKIQMCCGQITQSTIDKICPLAIPKQISTISMHISSLVKIIDTYKSYRTKMKIQMCHGQTTLPKIDKICPSAIANQIFTISMHIPSLVKNHWHLLKLSSGNKNTNVSCVDNCQMSSLVKIHWHLLKLSFGNENTDGQTPDGQTDVLTRGTLWGYSFDLSLIFFTPTITIFIYLSTL